MGFFLLICFNSHSFTLSDEELVVRWSENIVWQFFSGIACYEHRLPCDATQIGRFCRDLGEEGLERLLKATIDTAVVIESPAAMNCPFWRRRTWGVRVTGEPTR